MEITEVRIKLMPKTGQRIMAFCSITIDNVFVVRDLKVIQDQKGKLFISMPSRKKMDHCPGCNSKNHLRARFCNECGARLDPKQTLGDEDGPTFLYADIAHPIVNSCRNKIQEAVLEQYQKERELAKQPGYVCSYEEDFVRKGPAFKKVS